MKQLAKKKALANSHHQPWPSSTESTGTSGIQATGTGDSQPPMKKVAVRKLTSSMLAYSARKNSANTAPEYSTMWPATISLSPSTTSKGARLVSATPDTK